MVGDDDQSVYAFRGADIKNILDFEHDYPDAEVVKLEQNYRSTQTILNASNAVISNNRARKAKSLWSDLGDGEPVHVRELEDEHAEARFVVSEIERLVDEGESRDEIAVFYRTNAQSRVLEDMLVRYGVSYQVIGGTRFYERREIKDARLSHPAGQPRRQRRLRARGERAQARHREHSQARITNYASTLGEPVWDVASEPEKIPGLGTAAVKAVGRFMSVMERLRERVDGGAGVGDLLAETLEETGYTDALRAERTVESQVRLENLEELVGVAREYDAVAEEGLGGGVPPADRALLRAGQPVGRAGHRHADDPSQRQGPRVRHRLHHRARGHSHMRSIESGDLEEERRLAYVGITRAKRQLYLTHARTRALFGNRLEPAQPLHRRDPGGVHRSRRGGAHRPGGGVHLERWRRRRQLRPGEGPCAWSDDVVHAQFGRAWWWACRGPRGRALCRRRVRAQADGRLRTSEEARGGLG